MSGESTVVEFDEGFVEALGSSSSTRCGRRRRIRGRHRHLPDHQRQRDGLRAGQHEPRRAGNARARGQRAEPEERDTKVELTDFVVNPANSKLTGTVTANRKGPVGHAAALPHGSTLEPLLKEGNQAIPEGTTVTLTPSPPSCSPRHSRPTPSPRTRRSARPRSPSTGRSLAGPSIPTTGTDRQGRNGDTPSRPAGGVCGHSDLHSVTANRRRACRSWSGGQLAILTHTLFHSSL